MNEWIVYILECKDKSLYCGITNNIEKRLYDHNFTKSGAKYTRSRRPVILIATSPTMTKPEALKIELRIKKLKKHEKIPFLKNL